MGRPITLSPKHGVNPTIPLCFWCGQPKNEIALLGKIGRDDKEAPKNAVLDYRPCEECEKKMAMGFTVLEVTEVPNARTNVPMQKNVYPTGQYVTVQTEAAKKVFGEELVKQGRCLMTVDTFTEWFGQFMKKR